MGRCSYYSFPSRVTFNHFFSSTCFSLCSLPFFCPIKCLHIFPTDYISISDIYSLKLHPDLHCSVFEITIGGFRFLYLLFDYQPSGPDNYRQTVPGLFTIRIGVPNNGVHSPWKGGGLSHTVPHRPFKSKFDASYLLSRKKNGGGFLRSFTGQK